MLGVRNQHIWIVGFSEPKVVRACVTCEHEDQSELRGHARRDALVMSVLYCIIRFFATFSGVCGDLGAFLSDI